MKSSELSGGQRLGIILSLIWISIVAIATSCESFLPLLHSWLFNFTVEPNDPLGLFPHVVWSKVIVFLVAPLGIFWLLAYAAAWILVGFDRKFSEPYLKSQRLTDTLALIQVLALDEFPHRSESALQVVLQGKPKSDDTWTSLAKEHPEFFRVRDSADHPVSLIARHVLPKNDQGQKILLPEYMAKLIELAVELHDRQVRRVQAWHVFIPILVAVSAGVLSLISIALKN